MIDLEQEFQLLIRTVIKQINDKVTSGELTQFEAGQLTTMVNLRTQLPAQTEVAWSESTIECMEAYRRDLEGDDGWSGSNTIC